MSKDTLTKIFVLFVFSFLLFFKTPAQNTKPESNFAGVFFSSSITTGDLKHKYSLASSNMSNRLNILIVPGHDSKNHGAEYKNTKEDELNLELAKYLKQKLEQEPNFRVSIIRDEKSYDENFLNYLKNEKNIFDYQESQKQIMNKLANEGLVDFKLGVYHNGAPSEMVKILYGINKWSNENDIDLTIHIHFNDYAGRKKNSEGKYSGFSIYIPEKQYSNHEPSRYLADSIAKRLSKYSAVSDTIKERELSKNGVIEDQELIAVGSYNTLDAASLLIEYGFIYESQFSSLKTRPLALNLLAEQTYLGMMDYFGQTKNNQTETGKIENNLYKGVKNNSDVLKLQLKLLGKGFYPPSMRNLNDCPVSGIFGNCTLESVKQFQKSLNLFATGFVDNSTRNFLNQ